MAFTTSLRQTSTRRPARFAGATFVTNGSTKLGYRFFHQSRAAISREETVRKCSTRIPESLKKRGERISRRAGRGINALRRFR